LLAIKSGNPEDLKTALEENPDICLREALAAGSTEVFNYTFPSEKMTLPFESLGLAMILEESINHDDQ
jgi:hypothetical protein